METIRIILQVTTVVSLLAGVAAIVNAVRINQREHRAPGDHSLGLFR
jgi:hypothetical protein